MLLSNMVALIVYFLYFTALQSSCVQSTLMPQHNKKDQDRGRATAHSDEIQILQFTESEIPVSEIEELAGFRFVCPQDNNPPDVLLDCSDLPMT